MLVSVFLRFVRRSHHIPSTMRTWRLCQTIFQKVLKFGSLSIKSGSLAIEMSTIFFLLPSTIHWSGQNLTRSNLFESRFCIPILHNKTDAYLSWNLGKQNCGNCGNCGRLTNAASDQWVYVCVVCVCLCVRACVFSPTQKWEYTLKLMQAVSHWSRASKEPKYRVVFEFPFQGTLGALLMPE